MAISATLLGALGGSQVAQTPVSGTDPGGGGATILHTVAVPGGETWLIAVIVEITTDNYAAILRIGDESFTAPKMATTAMSMAVTVTATTTVELESDATLSFYSASVTGAVYAVPLEG